MFTIIKGVLTLLAMAFFMAPLALAQQDPAAAKLEKQNVNWGFKSKVFDIKHRDPNALINVLSNLGSGIAGSNMSGNSEFKTLTVRDFPENLAVIEEALKRLDVPAAPRPEIQLHMHILLASNDAGGNEEFPAELKDVVGQLRSTLMFKNYELATTVTQRLKETRRALHGHGSAEISRGPTSNDRIFLPYEYGMNSISLSTTPTGVTVIQMEEFKFNSVTDQHRASFQTALNIRDGEKVVVGTASIKSKAIIVVLTARVIK